MRVGANGLDRRTVLAALGATAGAALLGGCGPAVEPAPGPCPAVAGARIRFIVPHAAGGGLDAEGRLLAPFLARALGARVAVSNVAGTGGIVGANAIMSAPPDGRTVGLVNASGLVVSDLTGLTRALDSVRGFIILGRLARSWHVWATSRHSSLRTIEDVIAAAARQRLVFGLTDAAGPTLVSIAVGAHLLGLQPEYLPGLPGTRDTALAARRGDVDVVSLNFESLIQIGQQGELRALLQMSDGPISDHPLLHGVPCLYGPGGGWARRRAMELGRDPEAAERLAHALGDVMGAGRLTVAPPGLEPALRECLATAMASALSAPGLRSGQRLLDTADALTARSQLAQAAQQAPLLLPIVREALRTLRN